MSKRRFSETRRHHARPHPHPVWLTPDDCDLDAFVADITQSPDSADYKFAVSICGSVPMYAADTLRDHARDPSARAGVQAEFVRVLRDGLGIVVFRQPLPWRS